MNSLQSLVDIQNLDIPITQSMGGDILLIPFQVSDNIEKMEIEIQVADEVKGSNCIDYGINDPEGFRGWSGGSKSRMEITEDWATPGYYPGKIQPGTWELSVGLFEIYEPCIIKVKIKLIKKQLRWFKGDLHMHTVHSDGDYDPEEVLNHAYKEGLDFVALTDHNATTQNCSVKKRKDMVIIPGVELTTYKGHVNFWGIEELKCPLFCSSIEQIQEAMRIGREKDAIISLNHPFCKDAWKWGIEDFDFKYVEIWNGRGRGDNKKALDWWDEKLKKGERIVAVGGSDTHRWAPFNWYGLPTTWVQSDTCSIRGILEGIRSGKVCISSDPKAPRIELYIEETPMGDEYVCSVAVKNLKLQCHIIRGTGETLRLYSAEGLCEEIIIDNGDSIIEFNANPKGLYYRVELWKHDLLLKKDLPRCISNPIYIRCKNDM